MPNKNVTIRIGENSYDILFPSVGKEMDIDLLKIQMTDGKYENLKYSVDPRFQAHRLMVDAIATFNTLCPKIKEDLNAASMLDLSQDQMDVVVEAYTRDFLPWYEEWQALFINAKTKDEVEKKPNA